MSIIYYWSASSNGFYNDDVHGTNIPADCVEITEEQWLELLNGQVNNKVITSDSNGHPVLVDPPEPILNSEAVARQVARDSALSKLKALGLTDEEVSALVG